MATKDIVTQLLAEHELYQALFDAADDVLYCPHPGKPEKTGYPEDHHNDEAIPGLHAAFLALVDAPVSQIEELEGLKVVGVPQDLITQVMEAVQFYYRTMQKGRMPKTEVQEMFSKMIATLQSVLLAVAAYDTDVKDQVRSLLVEIRGVVDGDSSKDSSSL